MAKADSVRVTVEVEVKREPISGSLDDGNGRVTDFVGWLELMSALELACARAATPRDVVDGTGRGEEGP